MQNSTSSNNSQNPAPTDITPSVSKMSEESDNDDVWTCDDTADYLRKRATKACDTLESAKSAHLEAVAKCMLESLMSMHGEGGDAEDGDGDGDRDRSRTQGTLEGLVILTSQAYDKAAERSLTATARLMSHIAKHPHGAVSSLLGDPCDFLDTPDEQELPESQHASRQQTGTEETVQSNPAT